MQNFIQIVIGMIVLALGIPLGNFLAKVTKEELAQGKKYFKLIILVSLMGMAVSLFTQNDVLLFSFAFIAIVTSRSLRK